MALLGWLWLASPFVVIALISRDQQLQRLISAHYTRFRATGLAGAAMMILGAVLMPAVLGKVMLVFGAPLTGLVVFLRRDEGEEGGEDEPAVPPVDWDDFERSFWTHVRGRSPDRHRAPSAR